MMQQIVLTLANCDISITNSSVKTSPKQLICKQYFDII